MLTDKQKHDLVECLKGFRFFNNYTIKENVRLAAVLKDLPKETIDAIDEIEFDDDKFCEIEDVNMRSIVKPVCSKIAHKPFKHTEVGDDLFDEINGEMRGKATPLEIIFRVALTLKCNFVDAYRNIHGGFNEHFDEFINKYRDGWHGVNHAFCNYAENTPENREILAKLLNFESRLWVHCRRYAIKKILES